MSVVSEAISLTVKFPTRIFRFVNSSASASFMYMSIHETFLQPSFWNVLTNALSRIYFVTVMDVDPLKTKVPTKEFSLTLKLQCKPFVASRDQIEETEIISLEDLFLRDEHQRSGPSVSRAYSYALPRFILSAEEKSPMETRQHVN